MEFTKLKNINKFQSQSINPAKTPDTIYEVYSVPSFESGHPEYLHGRDIGSSKVLVEKDDVLLCKINPRINRVWVVNDESENINIASSEWIAVRNHEYNPQFLAWYFRSPQFQKLMISQVTGIGGSLTRAQPKQVAEYPVPIVDRKTQDHVSEVLGTVKTTIDYRKQELSELDTLIKARFVEMFKGESEHTTIENVCSNIVDCPHATPKYRGKLENPCIRTSEIKQGFIEWSTMKYVSDEEYKERTSRLTPEAGDIVYAREGSYGNAVVLPIGDRFCLGQRTMLLRPDYSKCTSGYLLYALLSDDVKRQADEKNNASTVPHVNVADVKHFSIRMPELNKQKDFDSFVSQLDKSKLGA